MTKKSFPLVIAAVVLLSVIGGTIWWKRSQPGSPSNPSNPEENAVEQYTVTIPDTWPEQSLPEENPQVKLRVSPESRLAAQTDSWQIETASGSAVATLHLAITPDAMGTLMTTLANENVWSRQLGDGFWVVAELESGSSHIEWLEPMLLSLSRI